MRIAERRQRDCRCGGSSGPCGQQRRSRKGGRGKQGQCPKGGGGTAERDITHHGLSLLSGGAAGRSARCGLSVSAWQQVAQLQQASATQNSRGSTVPPLQKSRAARRQPGRFTGKPRWGCRDCRTPRWRRHPRSKGPPRVRWSGSGRSDRSHRP